MSGTKHYMLKTQQEAVQGCILQHLVIITTTVRGSMKVINFCMLQSVTGDIHIYIYMYIYIMIISCISK